MDMTLINPVALPWQHEQWRRIQQLHDKQRLPHALLLVGPQGTGKQQFAVALAHYLLCMAPVDGVPCQHCRACQLLQAGTHPDLFFLQPEEPGKQIKVDPLRALVDSLNQSARQGGFKISIITPAEAMNASAANAFLKSLEEPAANTLLLLVADSPARLLPTIRSRCQQVSLPLPGHQQAMAWLGTVMADSDKAERLLAEASGQPLTAIRLFESGGFDRSQILDKSFFDLLAGRLTASIVAENWREYELLDILNWFQRRTQQLIRHLEGQAAIIKPWQSLTGSHPGDLFGFSDTLTILLFKVSQGAVPNRQLVLEDLLLQSGDIFHT